MTLSQHRYQNFLFAALLILGIIALNFGPLQPVALAQSSTETLFLPVSLRADANTVQSSEANAWVMAAANPERTSWTPEEVRGVLRPLWYKPFQPYIAQKVQIIAADGLLYIATANGLYALDAESGAERWVYPTELPLGHSPTIANGVVYVGGFDRKLHAIDAVTGAPLWTFEAGAGFHTNPLVVEGMVYIGNRNGLFYAIHTQGTNIGKLAWQYPVGAPILYSAAYKDGVVFFAAEDSHAYALNSQSGALVWKSAKLPGAGFHSWWPVVYQNRVIFAGSNNYRSMGTVAGQLAGLDLAEAYPNYKTDPEGTLIGPIVTVAGDWVAGTVAIDATRAQDYLEAKPWRRTYFVLDRATGEEREVAPVLWTGNDGAGNRYPPVVGIDGVLYQQNNYISDTAIAGGQISGWKIGTPYISAVSSGWGAIDEPRAYSAGGDLIYWNLCCDRQVGASDITIPNTQFADRWRANLPPAGIPDPSREWLYVNYNLPTLIPGYSQFHNPDAAYASPFASFGINGVHGNHGDQNPPIPYQGKVYVHRGNAIIAFSNSTSTPVKLAIAETQPAPAITTSPQSLAHLQLRLTQEIEKVLSSGHLRPGYHSHGLFDIAGRMGCGDDLVDYWHNPADTLYTLLQALPYLSTDLQTSVKSYLQAEFAAYPPYTYNHIGWRDGAARESFDLPPEIEAERAGLAPRQQHPLFVWQRNPYAFYVLWKYAQTFGNAQTTLNASRQAFTTEFDRKPTDEVLLKTPHVHNAYIAGFLGYLELEKLAGQPESTTVRQELDRLLQLRATSFTQDSAYANFGTANLTQAYCRTLDVANNFMYLVPELATYLHDHALNNVQAALTQSSQLAPDWFVSFADDGFGENYTTTLYDSHALFMARALILQQSGSTLEKYLDVPGFARGDLFYIQKLVAAIENYTINPDDPNQPNQNPTAANDGGTTQQNTPVTINVLANDSDSDGGTLTITSVGAPGHGTAVIASNQIPYTPTNGYSGADTFSYTISDGQGGSATATVTVTVQTSIPTPSPSPTPSPTPPITTGPRINTPYFSGNVLQEQTAIAWLGQVNGTSNYADIRVGYTSSSLRVSVNVFDRRLWYDTTASAADLTTWDAVTLYFSLTGNSGEALTTSSHRFIAQLNQGGPRTNYQAAAIGTGGTWTAASTPFTTIAGWRGDGGLNNGTDARGWVTSFDIPFASLGLSAAPATGTLWGLGVVVHDRDESSDGNIPIQNWPQTLNPQRPASWGQLAFGIPSYTPPSATSGGVVKIRQGLGGATVADAHVGGQTTCAQSLWPNFFTGWGSLNYNGAAQINIQNQSDVADWPCFSKYYVTFPLDSLPIGKAIISATLTLYQFGNAGQSSTPGPQPSFIQALTVTDTWSESTINWNNAPRVLENITITKVNPLSSTPPPPGVPASWDISRAVAAAYANGTPLRLVLYSADTAYHSGRYFWSSNTADSAAASRPTLDIAWGDIIAPVGASPTGEIFFPLITR